jgi:hypothetical protein
MLKPFFFKQPITDVWFIFSFLLPTNFYHKLAWKTCKTHTYSLSVKQSVVSIILYNCFSNNATDMMCGSYFLFYCLQIFILYFKVQIIRCVFGLFNKIQDDCYNHEQSVVSIILYNCFSNNATDINDFLCKILGYW